MFIIIASSLFHHSNHVLPNIKAPAYTGRHMCVQCYTCCFLSKSLPDFLCGLRNFTFVPMNGEKVKFLNPHEVFLRTMKRRFFRNLKMKFCDLMCKERNKKNKKKKTENFASLDYCLFPPERSQLFLDLWLDLPSIYREFL